VISAATVPARGRRGVQLQGCLNGGRSRAEHPRVPMTAEEIADDAASVVAAGAVDLHIHPRDDVGRQTVQPRWCDAVAAAVRAACPRVLFGFTTIATAEPDLERRLTALRAWSTLPDYVSVNFSEEGCEEIAQALLDRGVGIEAGLATSSDVERFLRGALVSRSRRILIEPNERDPGAAIANASAMISQLRDAGVTLSLLVDAQNEAAWPVLADAIERGHDVRIGLEDTLRLPDGSVAPDNAALVRAARALIERRAEMRRSHS
jgi:uncharacterized protein (DUF849 family)